MSFITTFAANRDIEDWMSFLDNVEDYFPGLNKENYQKTLVSCIEHKEALCAKVQGQIVGALLFSIEHCTLSFVAVHPDFRRRGIAASMMKTMLSAFPSGKDIWVTTYRAEDPKGTAARAFYFQNGFVQDDLVTEMGYPCQKLFLHRK